MGKRILMVLLAVLLVAIPLIAGCGGDEEGTPTAAPTVEKKIIIGWTPLSDPIDESRVNLDNGMQQGIKEYGGAMIYCSPSPRGGAVGDPATQAACVDTFIAAGVDGIVIFPVDIKAVIPSIKKANAAGIPVFLYSSFAPDDAGVDVVLSQAGSNQPGGIACANVMVDLLTEKYGEPKGLVLEVQGAMTTADGVERSGFWHDVIDEYPGIEVVSKDAGWDYGKGAIVIEDWMTAHPETDGFYFATANAYLPPAIPILDEMDLWQPIGHPDHKIITGNDAGGPVLYSIKCGYTDYVYDQGWQYAPLPFSRAVMQYLSTGEAPKEGDMIPTGVEGFANAEIRKVPGKEGLILMVMGVDVNPENADMPSLYGNALVGPPNGISPDCGEAGLWKADN